MVIVEGFQHVPTTVVVLRQPSQNIHTSREARRFVGDSAFYTSFRGASLLVGNTAEMVLSSATKVQSLVPHNNYLSYTVCALMYPAHYMRNASTHPYGTLCTVHAVLYLLITVVFVKILVQVTVGPYIVTQEQEALAPVTGNDSRRVEKKYQVFGIIGRQLILLNSPSAALIPSRTRLKVVEFWQPTNHSNIGVASVCSFVGTVVYKTY